MPQHQHPSWVYVLQCNDGSYYTGCTTNLEERVYQHQKGLYSGYTSKRRPIKLIWFEEFRDVHEAIDIERQIKGWSRKKKEALMRDDFELLEELSKSSKVRKQKTENT